MTMLAKYLDPEHVRLFIGFLGQGLFAARFLVQWVVSEKRRESIIPIAFWYFSLAGGVVLFAYSLYRADPVFIFGQFDRPLHLRAQSLPDPQQGGLRHRMALAQLHSSRDARGKTRTLSRRPLGLWIAAGMVLIFTLPLLPVDETRYLTVAWGDAGVGPLAPADAQRRAPTSAQATAADLAHQPRVVASAGPQVGVARRAAPRSRSASSRLTYRLARDLFPDDRETPPLAVMLTLVPVFYVYGSLLMFDQMLALWILLGLIALVARRAGAFLENRPAAGLGDRHGPSDQGPVILLHLLPPAPSRPLLESSGDRADAAAMVGHHHCGCRHRRGHHSRLRPLPPPSSGGPEFAHMIFWRQSAGRMVQSFSHRQPFWFYLLESCSSCSGPLLVWQPLWRSVTSLRKH